MVCVSIWETLFEMKDIFITFKRMQLQRKIRTRHLDYRARMLTKGYTTSLQLHDFSYLFTPK